MSFVARGSRRRYAPLGRQFPVALSYPQSPFLLNDREVWTKIQLVCEIKEHELLSLNVREQGTTQKRGIENMIDTKRVAEPALSESDTFRYHGTYSTADGCADLVALDLVSFVGWNRMKVYKGTKRKYLASLLHSAYEWRWVFQLRPVRISV